MKIISSIISDWTSVQHQVLDKMIERVEEEIENANETIERVGEENRKEREATEKYNKRVDYVYHFCNTIGIDPCRCLFPGKRYTADLNGAAYAVLQELGEKKEILAKLQAAGLELDEMCSTESRRLDVQRLKACVDSDSGFYVSVYDYQCKALDIFQNIPQGTVIYHPYFEKILGVFDVTEFNQFPAPTTIPWSDLEREALRRIMRVSWEYTYLEVVAREVLALADSDKKGLRFIRNSEKKGGIAISIDEDVRWLGETNAALNNTNPAFCRRYLKHYYDAMSVTVMDEVRRFLTEFLR